jgi:hypothetical protein
VFEKDKTKFQNLYSIPYQAGTVNTARSMKLIGPAYHYSPPVSQAPLCDGPPARGEFPITGRMLSCSLRALTTRIPVAVVPIPSILLPASAAACYRPRTCPMPYHHDCALLRHHDAQDKQPTNKPCASRRRLPPTVCTA